jgi:DNA-binding transcriptional LysR family regulator
MPDYDVVVVGSGNAGMSAAISAMESGARTLVIEKAAESAAFGNSRFTGGLFRSYYNDINDMRGLLPDLTQAEWDQVVVPYYTKEDFWRDVMALTYDYADKALTRTYIDKSLDSLEWLSQLGVPFLLGGAGAHGKINPGAAVWIDGGGRGLVAAEYNICRKKGVDFSFESQALDLISEAGVVKGLRVRIGHAEEEIRTPQVILACGGFQASAKLRAEYLGPLEKALGAQLFERSGNQLVLATTGKAFLPVAERMLELRQQGLMRVRSATSQRDTGAIFVGANNWSANVILPKAVSAFRTRMPQTGINLEVHSTKTLVSMLYDTTIDIAFLNPSLAPQLVRELVTYAERCVLVAKGEVVCDSIAELSGYPFLCYTVGPAREATMRIQYSLGRELKVLAASNSAQVVRDLCLQGLGLAILPYGIVRNEIDLGFLNEVRIPRISVPSWPVSLVTVPGRRLGPEYRAFVDAVAADWSSTLPEASATVPGSSCTGKQAHQLTRV